MNTRTHNNKKHMARKMLTAAERKAHTPIFMSQGWTERAAAIQDRVRRRHEAVMSRRSK